jgi:hypothetical protein
MIGVCPLEGIQPIRCSFRDAGGRNRRKTTGLCLLTSLIFVTAGVFLANNYGDGNDENDGDYNADANQNP